MENLLTNWSGRSSEHLKNCLPQKFYERDTIRVAKDLLGKILVVRSRPNEPLDSPKALITAGRIVETEAYHGDDPASHSSRGITGRSAIMFGEAGVAYVYFIYGMYEMLNFVTEKKDYPGAVLIRGVEPLLGLPLMQKRRKTRVTQLTNGPGKLSQAMGIKRLHNGQSLNGPSLFVLDPRNSPEQILASPRIGIREAKGHYWRFFIAQNPWVSPVKENALAKGALPLHE